MDRSDQIRKSYQTRSSVDPVLDHEYLDRMIENYAGGMELTNPYISPLFGKLEGLPPVYIQVGDNELLLSDSTQLHKISSRQMFLPESTFIRAWACVPDVAPQERPMTR